MTSELKVDKITPASGTNTQIGEAGDTTNLSAGTVTLPTSIITGASEKTTLVDADKFLIADSADSNAFKHVQKSNLPSGAMTLITRASGSSNVGNISLDNVFSDTYDYYRIFMWTNAPTSGGDFRFRWRKSGSDRTDSYYTYVSCVSQTSSSSSSIIVTNQSINLDYHNLFNNANSNANLGDITVLTIIDPRARDEGNVATLLSENSNYRQDSVWRSFRGAGFYGNQGSGDDFDGFKVYYTNSDINYYDYAIYGMNKT